MDFGSAKLSEKSIYQSSNLMKETRLLFDNFAINAEVGSLPVCRASRRTNKAQLRKEALRNQRHDSKDHLTCCKVSREVPVACFSLHKVDTGDKVRVGGNYPAVSEFCCRFRVRRLLCAPCGTEKRVQGLTESWNQAGSQCKHVRHAAQLPGELAQPPCTVQERNLAGMCAEFDDAPSGQLG